jgi:uncharacterized protein involved in exopolysaccharide biosynthesis
MKKYRRLSAHAKGEMENSIKKLLASAWAILIAKGKPRNHWRRYVLGAACSTIGIVGLSLAYLVLMPKSYSSEWAIILPGAGVESRVSVDRLGQAQSSARSPFSAKELSPRVNYKQIAVSAPVIGAAAKSLGLEYAAFGKPDVKLIDQTSIIKFRVSGTAPELAEAKAWALHEALKAKLDTLRADEIKRRNRAIRDSIGSVEDNLANARRKLLDLQQSSGLASIDQYNRLIGSITALRQDLAQAKSKLAETRSAAAALSRQLGIDAEGARDLLLLSADAEFRQLWQGFAVASAAHAEVASRLGPAHPRVADALSKKKSVARSIEDFLAVRKTLGLSDVSASLMSASHESVVSILGERVKRQAEMSGLEARVAEIRKQIDDAERRRQELGAIAARLDDLERDHKIANAVFGSALARIDASRSDIYASYPLLQILQPPNRPEKPSSPRPLFAAVGAVLGSMLAIMGWAFAWLHQWFASIRLTRKSYSPQFA